MWFEISICTFMAPLMCTNSDVIVFYDFKQPIEKESTPKEIECTGTVQQRIIIIKSDTINSCFNKFSRFYTWVCYFFLFLCCCSHAYKYGQNCARCISREHEFAEISIHLVFNFFFRTVVAAATICKLLLSNLASEQFSVLLFKPLNYYIARTIEAISSNSDKVRPCNQRRQHSAKKYIASSMRSIE